MYLTTLIKERYTDFVGLSRSHRVDKICAFGSSITYHFDPKTSDLDVVVKIDIEDPADRGEALLSLWDNLVMRFKRKVDLLTEDSIRNPYLKSNIDPNANTGRCVPFPKKDSPWGAKYDVDFGAIHRQRVCSVLWVTDENII